MGMSLILDISALSCRHTDDALEFLHKSISGGDDDELWDEHPSPLVRRLIELFTDRGLTRLEGVRKELSEWARGAKAAPGRVRSPGATCPGAYRPGTVACP